VETLAVPFPIIPHEAAVGVECGGCMVARAKKDRVELVCNECGPLQGAVLGLRARKAHMTPGIATQSSSGSGEAPRLSQ
jgi:hypothetical protein